MFTSEVSLGYEFAIYNRLKDDCQRFLILSSVTQRHGNDPDDTFIPSRLRVSLSRGLCQATRLTLPAQDYSQIFLNGKRYSGLLDNQASTNIMTLNFARKQRFRIVPKRVPFELADGSVQYSTGYTLLSCAFTRNQQKTRLHEFHIFATCIEPLILGRRLLYDMGILSPPGDMDPRSVDCAKEENSLVGKNPLGETVILRPEVRIHIRHSGGIRKILAVPDKGSDVNVMSLAFAQSLGYDIDRQGTSQRTLRLASGLMIRSVGIVCASFEIERNRARLDLMQKHFAVIVNFPFDIAFGNAFIHELKVFEANLSCLEWVHVREELPLLCPFMTAVHAGENCKPSWTHLTQQLAANAADRVAEMEAEESLKARRKAAEEKLRRQAQEEKWQKEAEEERSRLVSDEPANGGIENNENETKKRKNEKRRKEEKPQENHFARGLMGIFHTEKSGERRKDRQGKKSKRE